MSSARVLWSALGLGSVLLLTLFCLWPTVHHIEAWHWRMQPTPLDVWILAGTGLVIGGLLWAAFRFAPKRAWIWLLLVVLGLISQWGLALSRGVGIEEVRKHAILSGHGEFVWTGSRGLQPGKVLSDYENFLNTFPNQTYAKSKPPGQLLGYQLLGSMARAARPDDRQKIAPLPRVADEAHRQLIDFLTFAFPLLAALTLLPFFGICRTLFPDMPWWPPALFALGPSFALVLMHFDQAVYPLVCVLMWWAVVRGAGSARTWPWGILAGLMAGLGTFTTFALAAGILLCPFFFRAAHTKQRWWSTPFALGFLGALAGFYAVLWLGWDYDPLTRYQNAMAHHAEWKAIEWTAGTLWLSIYTNAIEFLWWLGPPTAVLFVLGLWSGVRKLRTRNTEPIDVLAWGTLGVLLFVLLFGKTLGEVARLWIFLMPPAFLIAASQFRARVPEKSWWWLGWLGWQLLWTIAVKYGQDFW